MIWVVLRNHSWHHKVSDLSLSPSPFLISLPSFNGKVLNEVLIINTANISNCYLSINDSIKFLVGKVSHSNSFKNSFKYCDDNEYDNIDWFWTCNKIPVGWLMKFGWRPHWRCWFIMLIIWFSLQYYVSTMHYSTAASNAKLTRH